MRSGGVEVAQKSPVPLRARLALLLCIVALSVDVIGDERFHGILGVAVRIGGSEGTVLGDGNHALEACRITVHSGGRGKDNVGDIVAGHGAEERDAAAHVDAVVL